MKVSGYLLVHNAAASIGYTLDYYLNYHQLDAICIVEYGSCDTTSSAINAWKDARVMGMRIPIEQSGQLPEIASSIVKELFLKLKSDWVLPRNTDEFFYTSRHIRLKAALHRLRQDAALPLNSIMSAGTRLFYESEHDDQTIAFPPHKMMYCSPGKEQRLLFYRIEGRFDELAASAMEHARASHSAGTETLRVDPVALACYCYPMPGLNQSLAQTLDAAALQIIRSGGMWLARQQETSGCLYEKYQHIKEDTFADYYRDQWYLSREKIAAGLADGSFQRCNHMLSYLPGKKCAIEGKGP